MPRSISPTGLLLDESVYAMLGFFGLSDRLYNTFVPIFNSSSGACASVHSNVFCSNAILEISTCGGFLGSPMFSGSVEVIKGIVIQDDFCNEAGVQGGIFHSISDYKKWISEVSNACSKAKAITTTLICSAVIMTLTMVLQIN